ncbi:alkaline phosphatase family protein [Aeoliella mucimassa]|uniref:Tetratricopeptide repeat protein n=1 Tax=Aeoliella mucimassa TaxID=2527972 RepID=A0A518AM75_9BACT|nr:alkaline phosphatase family protein [Aeoliella mucimassa]QDU55822.1 tetratricopeptide repeat protein [Aeoliella mucimassa]
MAIQRRYDPDGPKRVLLVGWDAADWQMIHPLIERGLMPTTAAFMQQGSWGNVASLQPMLSPILWNSIATGKRAQQHGVYGFTEPNADGPGVRPTSSTSRKCKALWNILTQQGLRSNVVGWYASHPAEPINGVMVSNQFEAFRATEDGITPPPSQSVWPAEMTEELAEFRVRPIEVDAAAILPFVPQAAKLLESKPMRLGRLQQMLAQTATVHALATHLIANTEWDFTAVYYEGIDRFGHEFMEFHPPKMEQVADDDFQAFQHCMEGIYRFHDMMLEALLTLAGDDTAVVLLSDHGYYNNHLRPDPREGKAGPVDWHRPFGVVAAKGPGIAPGTRAYGASLLDIAPTVLHLLGLPAGEDMPGRVLAEMLSLESTPERIFTWEEIEGDCGMHASDVRVDPVEAQQALQQLVDLGYIDPPSEDDEQQVADCIANNQLCLAQSYLDAGNYSAAKDTVDGLQGKLASSASAALLRASSLLGLTKRAEARKVLEELVQQADASPRVLMMLGTLEQAEGNTEIALEYFEKVAATEPRLPGLHNRLGRVHLSSKNYDLAKAAFEKSLQIDSDNAVALQGLAEAILATGDAQQALEKAMTAAEFVHHFPRAHLTVGKSLLALVDYAGAVEALELCTKQAPKMVEAHKTLATAYRALGENSKAMQAELRAKQLAT